MLLTDPDLLWLHERFVTDPSALFSSCLRQITWDERMRARKTASFGSPYNYSGLTYPAVDFPGFLLPVLDRLEQRLGTRSNNCLANFYEGRRSRMGFHADSTAELVPGTGIAIISLGSERVMTFRRHEDKEAREELLLPNGSLLYMSPQMQEQWQHAILEQNSTGPRISLTFRCLTKPEDDGHLLA